MFGGAARAGVSTRCCSSLMAQNPECNSACARKQERGRHVEDRISELPDEALVSILSLLTMKEAARTCVLSRRWEKLWTFILGLDFKGDDALQNSISKLQSGTMSIAERDQLEFLSAERPKYVNWVNRVLDFYQGLALDEFGVRFDLDENYTRDIDRWVYFALEKKVKRLELDLLDYRGLDHRYPYAFPLYCRETMSLYTSALGILRCNSLTSLRLKWLNISGETLEYFLFNCLSLEELIVWGSKALVNLKVAGPSLCLKHLEIISCRSVESIRISATKLVSFKYDGPTISDPFENVPNLVELSLKTDLDCICKFCQLSSCFSYLETLTLHVHEAEDLLGSIQFPILYHLKQLQLEVVTYDGQSLLGFGSLIKASPSLHRFTIKLCWYDFHIQREIRWPETCPHQSLKVVEVAGFVGRIIDTELLMYLVLNAINLEKMIIDPRESHLGSTRGNGERAQAARERAEIMKTSLSWLGDKLVIP